MYAFTKHAANPGAEAMTLAGASVSFAELRERLLVVISAHVDERTLLKEFSQRPRAQRQRIGIVGGMGPVAGAQFAATLELQGRAIVGEPSSPIATCNEEILMCSDPGVEAVKHAKNEAFTTIRSGRGILHFLYSGQLAHTCMASNTAHLMVSVQPSGPPASFFSIFEAVALECARKFPGRKVALLCTTPSMQFVNIGYGPVLKKHGVEFVAPSERIQELCMEGICMVKNPVGDRAESWRGAVDCFVRCILWYTKRGVSVGVLGCTEIPVVLSTKVLQAEPRLAGVDFELVDSVVALAQHFHNAAFRDHVR